MSLRFFQTSSSIINVMGKAVLKAAQGLIRDFGEVEHLQVSLKGPRDFVSVADQKAEKTIHYELSKARPTFGFLMEESGAIAGEEDMTWVIDPLDGTYNFLHSVPHFAISVGLLKGQDPIAGMIYDPLKNELFWAEKGVGAFMNGHKLRVSNRKRLSDAMIGVSHFSLVEKTLSDSKNSLSQETGTRHFGAAALDLAYVASGRFDGFVARGLKPWDVAAGIVLVREAGGMVSDWEGRGTFLDKGQVLASNAHLHSTLMGFLKEPSRSPSRSS